MIPCCNFCHFAGTLLCAHRAACNTSAFVLPRVRGARRQPPASALGQLSEQRQSGVPEGLDGRHLQTLSCRVLRGWRRGRSGWCLLAGDWALLPVTAACARSLACSLERSSPG